MHKWYKTMSDNMMCTVYINKCELLLDEFVENEMISVNDQSLFLANPSCSRRSWFVLTKEKKKRGIMIWKLQAHSRFLWPRWPWTKQARTVDMHMLEYILKFLHELCLDFGCCPLNAWYIRIRQSSSKNTDTKRSYYHEEAIFKKKKKKL